MDLQGGVASPTPNPATFTSGLGNVNYGGSIQDMQRKMSAKCLPLCSNLNVPTMKHSPGHIACVCVNPSVWPMKYMSV